MSEHATDAPKTAGDGSSATPDRAVEVMDGGAPEGADPESVDSGREGGGESKPAWHQRGGLWGGLALFIALLALPAPEGLSPDAWRTAAITALMATWWITEALPIAATSLVPLVIFPVMDIQPIGDAAPPYANPLIFLFMGGFMLAVAMQRWGLHRRIALSIVNRVGTTPSRIVLGFIIASAFLSMWVSNTATTLMMLPIAVSVISLNKKEGMEHAGAPNNFGLVLVLAIAYACNIGGMGTLIGTPPNAVLAGFMSETYGVEIGFVQWFIIGLPLLVAFLPLLYLVLTWVYPFEIDELPGGSDLIEQEIEELGAISVPERRVAWVFAATALLWMTRPLLEGYVPGLSDAGIAMAAGLALFVVPARGVTAGARGLLNWEEAEELPWGILVLFGGGLSLAGAISDTGLARWIGQSLSQVGGLPIVVIILLTVTLVVFMTESTGNLAVTATFMPILGAVAIGIGQNPFLLVLPATLAASCAFMLPVATPPNAIVYSSGYLTIPQMSRVGILLNVVAIGLITALGYALLGVAFGVELGTVPGWAE